LKRGQAHPAILEPVLRNLAVSFKFCLPGLIAHRRNDAGHRLPLGDRQTGSRQTRQSAQRHHRGDEDRDRHKPTSQPLFFAEP